MTTTRKNHAYGINLATAHALTQARREAGFTIESLAAALPDISYTSVQRYLSGTAPIDVENLSQICKALGVSRSSIIERAEELMAEADDADAYIGRAISAANAQVPSKRADSKGKRGAPKAG